LGPHQGPGVERSAASIPSGELRLFEVTAEFVVERRNGADDLYDPPGDFYKLNIDHVYIAIW
jgi:hypothetical protein